VFRSHKQRSFHFLILLLHHSQLSSFPVCLLRLVTIGRGLLHRCVRTLESVVGSGLSLAALVRPVKRRRAAAGVDRPHAEVAEARLVRRRLGRRIAVLFRVDRGLVGRVRVHVHVGSVAEVANGSWRAMIVVDRSRFIRVIRLIVQTCAASRLLIF